MVSRVTAFRPRPVPGSWWTLLVGALAFAGPSPQIARAAETEALRAHAAAHPGSPWRGQQVFHDPAMGGCLRCHAVAGHGGNLGPDLTTLGSRRSRTQIVEAILEPDRTVLAADRGEVFELRDGRTVIGRTLERLDQGLRIADTEGGIRRLAGGDVIRRSPSPHSLMPGTAGHRLNPDPFADLVAYCESLKSDPRLPLRSTIPAGFESLFDGQSLAGFKVVPGWHARDGVLVHDGTGDHLWHTRELGDFELRLQWRWPDPPKFVEFPAIGSDGNELQKPDGQPLLERVLDAGDSGVLLRGLFKAQLNLFCYPVGSGEFWEYREAATAADRPGFTPRVRADRPIGQWNDLEVRLVGDRVTVRLNGTVVIEQTRLPGLPARGPVGFQHEHGRLELRDIWVREWR